MSNVRAGLLLGFITMTACTGPAGPTGAPGTPGDTGAQGPTGAGSPGAPGLPGVTTGSIHGVVKDGSGNPIAGVAVSTAPGSSTATTDASGAFAFADIAIGAYSLTATKAAYGPYTLAGVGVIAGGTTNVVLTISIAQNAPGTISGVVQDARPPTPQLLGGVTVRVEGSTLSTTTAMDGTFTLSDVPPGPVFLSATAADASHLDTETRSALTVTPNATITGVKLVMSMRPSDTATYVGASAQVNCSTCHAAEGVAHGTSAHLRSLTRIARDGSGHAVAGGFQRMLNATLSSPRVVMVPLAGSIQIAVSSKIVVGAGTTFATAPDCGTTVPAANSACSIAAGDELGYTPVGLGWTSLGLVQSVDGDGQLTLTANAAFAPGVTSLPAGTKYGVRRLSRSYAKMLPLDANDIVAPAWPGVKATNPNYDVNDPCIYNAAAPSQTCAAGGTAKYADGQVNVYLCNLKDGVSYVNDEYVQKFGGSPYTCSDGTFYDGITTPAVPLAHIDVIYGGQGDKDGGGAAHLNMGVFKQRFQGRLADVKAADAWNYSAGKALDSLTLPIQFLESGDKVNGGFKMNGYHPTEQKFPGESWTQRTRTFSHACAGCHNTGMSIAWDMTTVTLPFGRDGAPNNSPMTFAAIKSYSFLDENITCEQCHGPGSEHIASPGTKIINPKWLTADGERQLCAKCHGYDDATNAKPAQDYGFEYAWNSDFANKIGGGAYIPGVYDVSSFYDNWSERQTDDEAFWDPAATGGTLFGQAHRQQFTMLAESAHTNNPYAKLTCTDCHTTHSQYLASPTVQSSTGATYDFTSADYRNNVACLSCHAGYGPFAGLSKDDVANVHVAGGGLVTKNGMTVPSIGDAIDASQSLVASVVGQHMQAKANMPAVYSPTNEALPVGRCTSCHMPKVAKSGGYTTGNDASTPPNKAIIEGDQASHVFTVVWPWQSTALTRGGPTFQSGYIGQSFSATNVKYDQFGYMPSSCGKCHAEMRAATQYCPDTATVWPSFWPYSEHPTDAYWSGCFTSSKTP